MYCNMHKYVYVDYYIYKYVYVACYVHKYGDADAFFSWLDIYIMVGFVKQIHQNFNLFKL